jgi:hypothetical protein
MVSKKIERLRSKVKRKKKELEAKRRLRGRKKRKRKERVRKNEPEGLVEEAQASARQTKLLANELGAQKISEAVKKQSQEVSDRAEVVSGEAGDVPLTEPAEQFATASGTLFDTVEGEDRYNDGFIQANELILGKDFDNDREIDQPEEFSTFDEAGRGRSRRGPTEGDASAGRNRRGKNSLTRFSVAHRSETTIRTHSRSSNFRRI